MAFSHSGIKKNALLRAGWSHYRSADRRIRTALTPGLVQIPNWYFPHSGFTGALWIEMQPKKLDQINTGGRGGTYRTSETGSTYRFLAPVDGIQETNNHDWAVYESMQAKLLKMLTNLEVGAEQIGSALESFQGTFERQLKKGEMPTARDFANAITSATAFNKPKVKIDSPLAYENSARREYLFTFPLLSEGLKTDLVQVVKDIQGYAAPGQGEAVAEIEWPHVWSLQSEPRGILDVDIAACTSVQVTWQDPYISGVPQRCELTLGFKDISPLFKNTIVYGSVVKVTSSVETQKHTSFAEELKNKGSLPKEIKAAQDWVKEKLGYPQKDTPINP